MFSRLSYLLDAYQQEMFPTTKPAITPQQQQQPPFQPPHSATHTRHESRILEIAEKSEIRITAPRPAVLRQNHVELSPLDTNWDNSNRDRRGGERDGETGSEGAPGGGGNDDVFADDAPDAEMMFETPVVGDEEHEHGRDPFADPEEVEVEHKAPERSYTGESVRRG